MKNLFKKFKQLSKGTQRIIVLVGLAISIASTFAIGSTFNGDFYKYVTPFLEFLLYIVLIISIFILFLTVTMWIIDGYKK